MNTSLCDGIESTQSELSHYYKGLICAFKMSDCRNAISFYTPELNSISCDLSVDVPSITIRLSATTCRRENKKKLYNLFSSLGKR